MKKIIGYHGSEGANAHLACLKFCPEFEPKAYQSFEDVFAAVESGTISRGMFPLENSAAGRVTEIYNLLSKPDKFSIVKEGRLRIEHHLASIPGSSLKDIKKVFSHYQALAQCKKELKNLKLEACEYQNTALAAKFIAEQGDKESAALCSRMAAKVNGLEIVRENLQDDKENATLFIVISKWKKDSKSLPDQNNSEASKYSLIKKIREIFLVKRTLDVEVERKILTSWICQIPNKPKALYKAIGCFANNDLNIVQFENFIKGTSSKQAYFFITAEANPNSPSTKKAIKDLKKCTIRTGTRNLGSYDADQSRSEGAK